jgi:predicted transcriptional regulator
MELNGMPPGGGSLRQRRKAAGLTQQGLAVRAHCSMHMVQLLEGGYQPTSSAVLARVLRVLSEHDPPRAATTGRETADSAGDHGTA